MNEMGQVWLNNIWIGTDKFAAVAHCAAQHEPCRKIQPAASWLGEARAWEARQSSAQWEPHPQTSLVGPAKQTHTP